MGKTEAKNLDLKSKLSIVLDTIANAKKDIESFKNEFNDFKLCTFLCIMLQRVIRILNLNSKNLRR